MNEKNIMEQVIEESDRMNIVGALDAFIKYIGIKRDTAGDKSELQNKLNGIKKAIDKAQIQISQYAISDRAIDLAEEIQTMTVIDKLFLHFLSEPNGVDLKEITDQAWGECAVVCEYKDNIRSLPLFLGKYSECKTYIDTLPDYGVKRTIIRKPTHVVYKNNRCLYCGQHDECDTYFGAEWDTDAVMLPFDDTMMDDATKTEVE